MMKGITYSILLILLIANSCRKDHENDDCIKTGIQGEWQWIKSEGGVSGATITPENAGYTKRLEIDDITWKEFMNDSLVWETQYIFYMDPNSVIAKGWIEYNSGKKVFAEITACNLALICGFEDCLLQTYTRNK